MPRFNVTIELGSMHCAQLLCVGTRPEHLKKCHVPLTSVFAGACQLTARAICILVLRPQA
jgi:hypothetical protein